MNLPVTKKNNITMLALLLLFIVPLILSWWLFYSADGKAPTRSASHGDLITPARPLADANLYNPVFPDTQYTLHGKWSLVSLSANGCDNMCLENMYRMRQIQMAAGEHSLRVQRLVLIKNTTLREMLAGQLKDYRGQLSLDADAVDEKFINAFKLNEGEDLFSQGRLYIIDPLGNLMMSYPHDADPIGIIKDLKRLLKLSMIG